MSVLILDDEELMLMLIEQYVYDLGFSYVSAISVDQAMQHIDGCDFALLDYNLGNGRTSCPVAARLYHLGIPFMFIMRNPHQIIPGYQNILKLGKPFTFTKFEESINTLMSGSRLGMNIVATIPSQI